MSDQPAALQREDDYDELATDTDYGEGEEQIEVGDPNAFKIREPLDPPEASVRTTKELHKLIHDGDIDLNPPYQRDVVWPEQKQIALIDSIFRNFYIPPILFRLQEQDGETVRVCMDGKQRLTSIQKFFDGQIPHKDAYTKKKFWYTRSQSQSGRLAVPEHYKRIFASKQITCVEYSNLKEDTERDIFQRVQLGVPLTAAEKLAAIDTPYTRWISELDAKHIKNDDGGLTTLIEWDNKRGRNFQCLAQLIFCCEKLPMRSEPTVAKLEAWLRRIDEPVPQFKVEIEDVITTYLNIAVEPSLNAGFKQVKKRVAPVEFVFIGVLLEVLKNCSLEEKARQILELRKYVREKHKDVRQNGQVVSTLWKFIEDARSSAPASSLTWAGNGHNGNAASTFPKKRKRIRGEDGNDDDYRPQPVMALGPAPITRARTAK